MSSVFNKIYLCDNIAAISTLNKMNLVKTFAFVLISLFAVWSVQAQKLSKTEKKKLKKELKQYKKNPITYKKAKEKAKIITKQAVAGVERCSRQTRIYTSLCSF